MRGTGERIVSNRKHEKVECDEKYEGDNDNAGTALAKRPQR